MTAECDHCGKTFGAQSGYHESGCHLCRECDQALTWAEIRRERK